MTEFIMFGGKGGVGKTTMATATALSLAKDGYKTLIVSTDPAHSIADVFEVDIGSDPTTVYENIPLKAREVDPEKRLSENYADAVDAIVNEASKVGVDIDETDYTDLDGGVIGSDEAAVIDLFDEYDGNDDWDYVVFDTAPTGHTLRMLQLPELLDSVVGTVLDFKQKYDSVKGTITGVFSSSEDGETDISDVDVEQARNKMERVSDILRDPAKTKFYAVMEPEGLSLLETKRLLSQLREYEISVGGVFVNKVLKDINEDCQLCSSRQENQQEILKETEDEFDVPVLTLPLYENPPRRDNLHNIADKIQVS